MTERGARRGRPEPEPRVDGFLQQERAASGETVKRRSRPERPMDGRSALPPLPTDPPPRSRARRAVESPATPSSALPPLDDLPRRRLSDEERLALRDRRRAALPPLPEERDERAGRGANPGRKRSRSGSTSSRDEPAGDRPAGGAVARRTPAGRARDRADARTVTLGALLFVGLVAVTFGAGGLFGTGGSAEPTPTATAAPTVIAPLAAVPETPTPAASPVEMSEAATDEPPQRRWPGDGDGRAVVCLDPGHGGWDPGYTRLGAAGLPAMAEADYNLAHAYDLAERLRARGFVVVMTRRTPNAVNAAGADVNGDGRTIANSKRAGELDELQARIDVCNAAEADLLVSMHVNGYDARPEASGYETWYTGSRSFGEQSERFASLVFRALGEEMTEAGYAAAAREVNDDDKISTDSSDPRLLSHMIMTGPDVPGLIRASNMPGAIVECLFISNDADAAFLASPEGHEAIVAAYEAAIVEYFAEFPG